MLKPFTAEGRFECGLDNIVRGKVWCFVNVVGENYPARLGIAIANESGYSPIPEYWCHADSYDELDRHAEELNAAEGIDVKLAVRIVYYGRAADRSCAGVSMNLYPCSGCGSRHCDGRCFLESAADYPEVLEHQRINDTLAPVAHVKPWEVATLFVGCIFLGYALAVQF